jgi:hypothetical protein
MMYVRFIQRPRSYDMIKSLIRRNVIKKLQKRVKTLNQVVMTRDETIIYLRAEIAKKEHILFLENGRS